MLKQVAWAAGAGALLPLVLASPAIAVPTRCAVIDGAGRCLVAAADPGRAGGPAARPEPVPPQRRALSPDELRSLRLGQGREAAASAAETARARALGWPIPAPPEPPAAAAVTAAVDPAVPAQLAISELGLAAPVLRLSVGDRGFVGVPIWLWIERGPGLTGPASATAAVGDARVTATGRLERVEWRMGPPGETVVCEGPGTPWAGQTGPSPDCGYVYELRSLPERTDGTGAWSITATSVWQVSWSGVSGGTPVAGEQVVRVPSQRALPVGEVHVLVSGGGG